MFVNYFLVSIVAGTLCIFILYFSSINPTFIDCSSKYTTDWHTNLNGTDSMLKHWTRCQAINIRARVHRFVMCTVCPTWWTTKTVFVCIVGIRYGLGNIVGYTRSMGHSLVSIRMCSHNPVEWWDQFFVCTKILTIKKSWKSGNIELSCKIQM